MQLLCVQHAVIEFVNDFCLLQSILKSEYEFTKVNDTAIIKKIETNSKAALYLSSLTSKLSVHG